MSAKITISSPEQDKLEDIALILAQVFEKYPREIAKNFKIISDENAPKMGVGTTPTDIINLDLVDYSQEELKKIEPLIDIIQALLNKLFDNGVDVSLWVSDGKEYALYSGYREV